MKDTEYYERWANGILPGNISDKVSVALTDSIRTACVTRVDADALEQRDIPAQERDRLLQIDAKYLILVSSRRLSDSELNSSLSVDEATHKFRTALVLHEILHILKTALGETHRVFSDHPRDDTLDSLFNALEDGAIETEARTSRDWSTKTTNRLHFVNQVLYTPVEEIDSYSVSFVDAVEFVIMDQLVWNSGKANALEDPSDSRVTFNSPGEREAFEQVEDELYNLIATIMQLRSDEEDGLFQNSKEASVKRAKCLVEFWDSHVEPLLDRTEDDQLDSGNSDGDSQQDASSGDSQSQPQQGGNQQSGTTNGHTTEGGSAGGQSPSGGGSVSEGGQTPGGNSGDSSGDISLEEDALESSIDDPRPSLSEAPEITDDTPAHDEVSLSDDLKEEIREELEAPSNGEKDQSAQSEQQEDTASEDGGIEGDGEQPAEEFQPGQDDQSSPSGGDSSSGQQRSFEQGQSQLGAFNQSDSNGEGSTGSESESPQPSAGQNQEQGGSQSSSSSSRRDEPESPSDAAHSSQEDHSGTQGNSETSTQSPAQASTHPSDGSEQQGDNESTSSMPATSDTRDFEADDFDTPDPVKNLRRQQRNDQQIETSDRPDPFSEVVEESEDFDIDDLQQQVQESITGGGDEDLGNLKTASINDYNSKHRRWKAVKDGSDTVTKALEKALSLDQISAEIRGVSSGQFDSSRAHRLSMGMADAFSRPLPGDKKEYHIILVLDRSRSMLHGGKIEAATRAVAEFAHAAELLGVKVSIIDFIDGEARFVKPPEMETKFAQSAILSTAIGGGTPLSDAFELARSLTDIRSEKPIIIGMTDDDPADVDDVIDQIEKARCPVCSLTIATDKNPGDNLDSAEELEREYTRTATAFSEETISDELDQFAGGTLRGL